MNKLTLSLLLTILTMSMVTLFTACPEARSSTKANSRESRQGRDETGEKDAGDKETPVTGKAAAGTSGTVPSITGNTSNGPARLKITFIPPRDWGTRDDGDPVNKKDITRWFFYLKDPAGDKTKEDIIKEVGTDDAVKVVTKAGESVVTDTDKGAIQLHGDGPYIIDFKTNLVQYAFFVRIIHPDSTIANKANPRANEGAEHKRDTGIVRAKTSDG